MGKSRWKTIVVGQVVATRQRNDSRLSFTIIRAELRACKVYSQGVTALRESSRKAINPRVSPLLPLLVALFLIGILHVHAAACVWQQPAPAVQASTATQEKTTVLAPGRTIDGTVAGGETHTYEIGLQQGQCA